MVRGKLFRPPNAGEDNPAPGVVYLHGYQNNRGTSDPYGIELALRGFVAITLDTLGSGNSQNQFSEDKSGFDPTYGADMAFEYLQSLPYVDADRCGLGGHSLGAEMSYLYEATGKIYPGAILNALIVTWMFTSSSVIAPLPI